MKRVLAAAAVLGFVVVVAPAAAKDKFGYSHDYVDEIKYGNGHILVRLASHKKKGEYGCGDPYYKITHEALGPAFEEVVRIVTQAATYGAKISLLVEECEGEDKEGASVVTEVKIDFSEDHDGPGYGGERRGSHRQ